MAIEEEPEASVPEWMVTFGDMMNLLLTFFVLLFSMSDIKDDKSMALIETLQRQFGDGTGPLSFVPGQFPATPSALNKLLSMGRASRMNTMNGGVKVRAPVGDYARVAAIRPADDSTQGGVIYFEEGGSQLTQEHRKTLEAIADVLRGKQQEIEIRGHTSPRPLGPDSPYRSHWDLAYARCFKVMEVLVELGINPKRLRIGVAADNEPIHTGYDELLRKRNDRVEVFMLDKPTPDLQGAEEKKPAQSGAEDPS
jgi:chemotaxis protein MotB